MTRSKRQCHRRRNLVRVSPNSASQRLREGGSARTRNRAISQHSSSTDSSATPPLATRGHESAGSSCTAEEDICNLNLPPLQLTQADLCDPSPPQPTFPQPTFDDGANPDIPQKETARPGTLPRRVSRRRERRRRRVQPDPQERGALFLATKQTENLVLDGGPENVDGFSRIILELSFGVEKIERWLGLGSAKEA
ncbi:hypothetical protein GGR53DRAFT_533017 [Hypoxylon sp. FL1150]|nr:hypothetical protein GGR53DRAFT_533017 [Hypoxylon sp. FL1150]